MKNYYVYILTNKSHKVLYTGFTSNLTKRIHQHKNNLTPGFTSQYKCHKLVWYTECSDVYSAISEEKRIKAGSRLKKVELIEQVNPDWNDLSLEF